MQKAYVVTGTLTNQQTLTLDEALPFGPTRVRVVVEPISTVAPLPYHEIMASIRERQRQRGHRSPTREEVDAALEAERKSWDE
jgi:hypothetical protein